MNTLRIFLLIFAVVLKTSQGFSVSKTDTAITQTVDGVVKSFMLKFKVPAVAVAVYYGNNERIFLYGLASEENQAPVTPHTLFEIGSVTKVFTSTALALHVLKKDILLNDPVQKFFPAAVKKNAPFNDITLLFLATHTSGLPKNLPGDRSKLIPFLRNWHPEAEVGTHYTYSNLAYGLLGYALEKIEKKPYKQVIKDDITDPLTMKMTFVEVPNELQNYYATGYTVDGNVAPRRAVGYLPGSGSIRSTIMDMLQFLKANMGIVGPEDLARAMKIAQEPFYQVQEGFSMGLGWQIMEKDGVTIVDKNGGVAGFTSYIGMIPKKNLGIVILTNKSKANVTEVGRFLLNSL